MDFITPMASTIHPQKTVGIFEIWSDKMFLSASSFLRRKETVKQIREAWGDINLSIGTSQNEKKRLWDQHTKLRRQLQ